MREFYGKALYRTVWFNQLVKMTESKTKYKLKKLLDKYIGDVALAKVSIENLLALIIELEELAQNEEED